MVYNVEFTIIFYTISKKINNSKVLFVLKTIMFKTLTIQYYS